MNQLIFLVILLFSLSSCSVTGRQEIVNVPGQNVSFIRPPLNWKNLTKTRLTQFKKNVPEAEDIENVFNFVASWTNNNYSTITIIGTSFPTIKNEGFLKEIIENGINKELSLMEKNGISGEYSITNENIVTKKGIIFETIEAEINGKIKNSIESEIKMTSYKLKIIYYYFDTSNLSYLIEFRAFDNYYDKDSFVFNRFLDSIKVSNFQKLK